MLAFKKKADAAKAAAAADAAAGAGGAGGAAGDGTGAAGGTGTGAPRSLFGGDDARGGGASTKRKMKPGEIRIQKDIAELDAGSVGRVTWPDPSKLTEMELTITPDQGLWKGAGFTFTISVPDMYPHEPPKVLCKTLIYHPNINLEGKVCLNILRDEWKPVLDINAVIYGLIYLFYEPNPNDPLNQEAAALFRDDKAAFERNVASSLRGGRVGGTNFPKLL